MLGQFPIGSTPLSSLSNDALVAAQTLNATAALIAGSASAIRNPTQSGSTLTTAATLTSGNASVADTEIGQTLNATVSLIDGTASAIRNPTQPGPTIIATATLTTGAATGIQNPTQSGATLAATASLIVGAASVDDTQAGVTLTATASLSTGTAVAIRSPTQAGATLAVTASFLPDAAGIGSVANGTTLTVTASFSAGTATGEDAVNIRNVRSDLLRFDFPSGTYGFFTGEGTFVYGGVTYRGAGSLFAIDAIPGSTDGSASSVSIRLNADADIGLTSTVLTQIEAESYRGRPVTISRAYFNAETYDLTEVFQIWRGYIDTIVHVETIGAESYIEATCESRALDLGRSGYRRRTDADQRRIDANDRSLRHVQAAASESVYWGRAKPAKTG